MLASRGRSRLDRCTSGALRRFGSLIYKLNREMQVRAEVREEWLRSTVPTADYVATVMLLGLRLQR